MRLLAFVMLASALTAARQAPAPAVSEGGQRVFEQFCSKCHGADGRGGERGPNIIERLAFRNDNELAALIRDGLPSAGMPGMALVRFVHVLPLSSVTCTNPSSVPAQITPRCLGDSAIANTVP